MPKLQKSKNVFTITIPKEIITKTGWNKGDTLFANYDPRNNSVWLEKIMKS